MVIPVRKVLLLLILSTVFLLVMSFFPGELSWAIYKRFELDAEANVPTWFATVLLFSVSLTSLTVYGLGRDREDEASLQSFWLTLSAVYCFLSLDEAACLHEIFDRSLNLKWVYVYAPLGAVFFATCVYYLMVINKDHGLRNWILGGLIVYALGGLGGEAFEHFVYSFRAEVVLEEGLELLGTVMVLRGCLQELNRRYQMGTATVNMRQIGSRRGPSGIHREPGRRPLGNKRVA